MREIRPQAPGPPREARWIRSEPRRSVPVRVVERIAGAALPHCRVAGVELLGDGLRNANFKVHLDSTPEMLVLRIYEHDASLCRKELDLMRLVSGSVPAPEVIRAEPGGWEDLPPFVLMRYVGGISFRDLARSGDTEAIAQAAYSAGEALAAIGRNRFPKPGWLAPGPAVTTPLLEGPDPTPRFVDLCLASTDLERRMPADLRDCTHALVWRWAPQLAPLEAETRLVHGDFNQRNVLVRAVAGKWSVAAVLDWEFAVSGCPLCDVGSFLRYERVSRPTSEPHFSNGYLHAGGTLPRDWRRLARVIALTALCEILTHDQISDAVVTELVELVRATVENRDPECA